MLLREWDIWYFIVPRMSIGVNWLWYDASNLRNDFDQEAHDLGICSTGEINAGACATVKAATGWTSS